MKKVFLSLLVASMMLAGCSKDDYKDDSKKSPLSSLVGTSWSLSSRSGFKEGEFILDFRTEDECAASFLMTNPKAKMSMEYSTAIYYSYYDTEIGGNFGRMYHFGGSYFSGKMEIYYTNNPNLTYLRYIYGYGSNFQVNMYARGTFGTMNIVYDYLREKIISIDGVEYTHKYTPQENVLLTAFSEIKQMAEQMSLASALPSDCDIESVTATTLVLKDRSSGEKTTFTRRRN